MQNISNPCVGIIIPIYNVAPYLRECLDSVINQTYQNLQIVLVDDGSTDESYSIAKEYFERDERIALIKRKNNGGMGASRNSALDYLSNSLPLGGGGIQILEHSSSKRVEYIHFLDSDDWLELDCIEKCVDTALKFQAQIIWHGCKHYYESTQEIKESDFPKQLGLNENRVYSGLEIFSKLSYPSFSWVWQGLITMDLSQKIRFEEGIESEDAIFGMQTYAISKRICLDNRSLMFYRIRPNSASQHTLVDKNTQGISFPPHQQDLLKAFNDIYVIRHYRFAYSCAIISLRMDEFIQREKLSNEIKEILKSMIEERAFYAFGGLNFEKDPRNIREICSKLLAYTSKVRWSSKLAYYCPSIFRILRKIKDR